MPGLGETIGFLKHLHGRKAPPAAGRTPRVFSETAAFGANRGGLRMLSYAPAGLPAGAPLVVVLHGCTQDAEGHAVSGGWVELAARLGFAVLAPEQSPANNPNRCFNWFSPADVTRGQGEVASIAAMIDHMAAAHRLDAARVYVTGLSAGGAMAAAMLAAYPERFAGGAVVAGLPYGAAASVQDALRIMQRSDGLSAGELGDRVRRAAPHCGRPVRLAIWHGDADTTVCSANGADLAAQWTSAAGLAGTVPQTEDAPGRQRTRWSGADGSAVELNRVAGLGHGTPLSTRRDGDVGSAAPFMVECGVSSTLEIAAFWGLEPMAGYERATAPAALAQGLEDDFAPQRVGDQVMEQITHHVGADVKAVIEKALRGAGLMK